MLVSLKRFDDRPIILWRFSLVEPDDNLECKMKNTPLDVFICTQVLRCKFDCIQKTEQLKHRVYVREQQEKMLNKIRGIAKSNNGNNGNNGNKKYTRTNNRNC